MSQYLGGAALLLLLAAGYSWQTYGPTGRHSGDFLDGRWESCLGASSVLAFGAAGAYVLERSARTIEINEKRRAAREEQLRSQRRDARHPSAE